MLLDRFRGYDRRLAAADALADVARLDFNSDHRPALIPFSPVSRGNPYQALMYGQLPLHNMRAVPAYDLATTVTIADALREGPAVVAHLHWLNVVMQSAANESEARQLLTAFTRDLDRLKDTGAGLMWTVHNVLPHDAPFPDLEVELRRIVVDKADLVHVMSPRTRELVSEWFTLPADRTFTVAHPSYEGVYPQAMPRTQARAELGLPEHATVFVLFGRIAPYKGVTELVAAFDALAQERPGQVALVLAGNPVQDEQTESLHDVVTAHPAIHAAFRKIPDTQVQTFCAAADIMALPYRRSLNSGALNLALTFGLPIVLPASSGEAGTTDSTWAQIYDDNEPDALLTALRTAADRLTTPAAAAAARQAAALCPPAPLSEQFASVLRHWIDTGTVDAATRA